jgi:hypothetical protein
LTYLYNRYISEYGTNPNSWKSEGSKKVKKVYDSGSKVSILANRDNNAWNSLIANSVISDILNSSDDTSDDSKE